MSVDRPGQRDGSKLPDWPRALKEVWAAAYVGLSASTFRQYVAPQVPPIRVMAGRVAWLREDLDAWLDQRAGRVAAPPQAPVASGPPQSITTEAIAAAVAAMGRPRRRRPSES